MYQFYLLFLPIVLALYSSNGPVELLSGSDFNKKVVQSDKVYFVEFFAPWCGHCKNLVPEWEKSAKALSGIVNVAAVDATVDQSLASQYGVQGYPTILIFGSDKSKPEKYQGDRSANAITDAALKAAKELVKQRLNGKKPSSGGSSSGSKKDSKNDVVELTSSNFDELVLNSNDAWLVEFFAPWCGHCKNLAPEWAKAATDLKGSVKVGAVDATIHGDLAQKYDVKGYPTIKFFAPGDKSKAIEYNAGRTSDAIVQWALGKLDEYGVAPDIIEVVSEQALKDNCYNKPICVVGVLPHLIDGGAKARLEYIEVLKEAAKQVRGKPINIVWVQGGVQEKFESTYRMNFGYPALVVISEPKKRYFVHKGSFTSKSIASTLKDVLSGRQRTQEVRELPKLVTTTPWDGKDYEPPTEE
eukprot:NODE_3091_length_1426_cov_103.910207_g2685_i0.p1 GENE.NODE_3091_length_1426_cov_103.910207_g2685_i0~~NODE_3091_length_1426_cov_103.910207_g2685_i0.p1  ORF type:complete len:430 (-),score=98.38 NODE_3091_length_1426_cov_103.910207_g2685_i0:135-1373(-)